MGLFINTFDQRILCASSDELTEIVVFIIIMAIGVIGNLTKAKAQKRTSRTGKNQSESRPRTQRTQSEKMPPPVPGAGGKAQASQNKNKAVDQSKYYTPGGFAEIFKTDQTLEQTLGSKKERPETAVKKSKLQRFLEQNQEADDLYDVPKTQAEINQDLESMGQLEALDEMPTSSNDMRRTQNLGSNPDENGLINFESTEDLAKAVLYAEIFSKPVGLR